VRSRNPPEVYRPPPGTSDALIGHSTARIGRAKALATAVCLQRVWPMRFPMRLDLLWRPLLALFGGTPGRAYVEVTPSTVRFRFGWLFDVTLPRPEIIDTQPVKWPWWLGIGWRIVLRPSPRPSGTPLPQAGEGPGVRAGGRASAPPTVGEGGVHPLALPRDLCLPARPGRLSGRPDGAGLTFPHQTAPHRANPVAERRTTKRAAGAAGARPAVPW